MFKIILPLVLITALSIGVITYHKLTTSPANPPVNPVVSNSSTPDVSPLASAPQEVPKSLPSITPAVVIKTPADLAPTVTALAARVTNLEAIVANLQAQINAINTSRVATTQTSSNAGSPTYIFALGSTESTTQQNYTTLTNLSLNLDPANYPGFKSMQLEVSLSVYQGNGMAYAILYNSDAGTQIISSQVSTNSYNPTWVSSNTFTPPSGAHTYQLQLKTNTGYAAQADNFRIKVNY